jgi:hypothetical protein
MEVIQFPTPRRAKRQPRAMPYELRRAIYLHRTGRGLSDEAEQLRARISQLRALGAIPKEDRHASPRP